VFALAPIQTFYAVSQDFREMLNRCYGNMVFYLLGFPNTELISLQTTSTKERPTLSSYGETSVRSCSPVNGVTSHKYAPFVNSKLILKLIIYYYIFYARFFYE